MKKKRFTTMLLTAAMVFGTVTGASAADQITVTIDGEKVNFKDQQPVNINDRVMVPVRDVAEKMGWEVSFETFPGNTIVNGIFQPEDHVTMQKFVDPGDDLDAKFSYVTNITIDTNKIVFGNDAVFEPEQSLKVKPIIKNGRTLLGIRDIAEGLYADIQWNEETKTVAITTKPVEQFPNYDELMNYIEEYRKVVNEQKSIEEAEKNTKLEQKKIVEEARSGYAEEMLRLVNNEREKAGATPLELDDTLTEAANIRAKEICEVFDHTRPNGENFRSLLDEMDVDSSYTGENINKGTFEAPESAMELWMSSETHKRNILNPNYKYIGIGYVFESESNGVFDDTVSHWVQIFSD